MKDKEKHTREVLLLIRDNIKKIKVLETDSKSIIHLAYVQGLVNGLIFHYGGHEDENKNK